jgi:hypothetical protein
LTTANTGRVAITIAVDPAVCHRPQGYQVRIAPDEITITARETAGAFYAVMTLKQLARQIDPRRGLPCLTIEDWPDFPVRGVMLDISRAKVPKLETLLALTDLLAEWKINQFQLYTEHTFAYRNHHEVWEHAAPVYAASAARERERWPQWEGASPVTGEEILQLDAHCRARHIHLVPNQNSFGHFARWLHHPKYLPLAEAPEGFAYPWGARCDDPVSLCPLDPGALRLIGELYAELLPHFTSHEFNVGCDETFDLGLGRSKDECAKRGTGRVYLDFLKRIHSLVARHGRSMQFWGDIILKHPELIPELPQDAIALVWGYEAGHPFDAQCAAFARSGLKFYVCPGTSAWNAIAGRTANMLGNLRNAAASGLKHGAGGYLNTDWGDGGHWHALPASYPGYAYGAAVSWALEANRGLPLARALDLHAFRDAAGAMGKLACALGDVHRTTGILRGNCSTLFWILFFREAKYLTDAPMDKLQARKLERTERQIDALMRRLPAVRMACKDARLIADEFRYLADMLRHACRSGAARVRAPRREVAQIPKAVRRALAAHLRQVIAQHRRVWLARNRPGGMQDSARPLQKLLEAYRG